MISRGRLNGIASTLVRGDGRSVAIVIAKAEQERLANSIRSIARCFESDVEDKSCYYDRDLWSEYLGMLAAQPINRFSMTYRLGYNWPMPVSDVYLYFTDPFLFAGQCPDYDYKRSYFVFLLGSPEAGGA